MALYDFSEAAVDAVPSATVVLVRDVAQGLEVLLLQRNPELRAMGGAWVFPGGKIDALDPGTTLEARARCAAVRELEEEAGLVVPLDALSDFSHWLTPLGVKHRFATWFYIAGFTDEATVEVDGSEIVDHRWISPSDALAEQRAGTMTIAPPTLVSLTDLVSCPSVETALAETARRQPPYFFPRIVKEENVMHFLYPGDAGYDESDPAASGTRHRSENRSGQFSYFRDFDWPPRGQ